MNDALASADLEVALASTAVAEYSKIEAGLADLRARYAGAKYEVGTAKGMAAARAARGELRDTRLALEEKRVEAKRAALEYGRLVDAEAKRIEAAIVELEEPIAAQVQAEDKRKADEKAAREQAERERVALIRQRIDWIRERPVEAAGKSAAELLELIEQLTALPFTDELYAEFKPEANAALVAAREKLVTMRRAAVANEGEAARLAAEREEFERNKAAERKRLDDERVERERVDGERKAKQAAEDKARADRIAAEDAERARVRAAEDAERAAAKAEQDRKDEAARAEQVAASNAAAAAELKRRQDAEEVKRKERAALEARADPWPALRNISATARDGIAIIGEFGPWTGYFDTIQKLADDAMQAREALHELTGEDR